MMFECCGILSALWAILFKGYPLVVFFCFCFFNRLHDALGLVRTLIRCSWRNADQNAQTFRSNSDAALQKQRQQKNSRGTCNNKARAFASTVRVFDLAETWPCKKSRNVKINCYYCNAAALRMVNASTIQQTTAEQLCFFCGLPPGASRLAYSNLPFLSA